MNHNRQIKNRALLLVAVVLALTTVTRLLRADTGSCGGAMLTLPFSDVPSNNGFFCAIAEAYFTGLTNGTSATDYTPSSTVTREQMAAFITRTLDQSLKRGNRRAVLQQWWTPTLTAALRPVELGAATGKVVYDGSDLWVVVGFLMVSRIEASSGRVSQIWSIGAAGPPNPSDVIAAAGRIYILATNSSGPGRIYRINPEATVGGSATLFESDLGVLPVDITFDGTNLWTANTGGGELVGTISRVRVSDAQDATFSTGFDRPRSILWDGAALWVLDSGDDMLKEVNPATGAVISTLSVPDDPREMIFDGTNLWISSTAGSITLVRAVGALRGTVVQTITGNGLNGCSGLGFDGERVLVANESGDSVSLFKAADFTPLGSLSIGANSTPRAVCSDGVNFWITRHDSDDIVRF